MKFLKFISLFCYCLLLINSKIFSQQHPQLYIKLGAVKNLAPPAKVANDFAYSSSTFPSPYPGISFEYLKPLKKKNTSFFAGLTGLEISGRNIFLNPKNIQSSISREGSLGFTSLKIYAGFEKQFRYKKFEPFKNYFSWFVGTGVVMNFFPPADSRESRDKYYSDDWGTTNDGKLLHSTGLYMGRPSNSFFSQFSPFVFGGFRYHVTNKKGKTVLVMELMGSFGLTRYYNYEIDYTLDGQPHTDKIGEMGFNIQFNILIPLATFGKKKKKDLSAALLK